MNNSTESNPGLLPDDDRYSRQERFAPIGTAGQARLRAARVLICGCGALGSVLASILARSGVGYLRIVDRDFLEWNNLQRQSLYDEQDVIEGLPKAIAAARRLRAINRNIEIDPIVADIDYRNIEHLMREIDIVADGTDNFETRFLINDASIKLRRPWVYGGCIGAEGQTMTIVPGTTPCFRCLMPDAPPPGTSPTCDTAGVVAPIVHIVGAWQAMEVLKIASGNIESMSRVWTIVDLWEGRLRQIQLDRLRRSGDCPACDQQNLEWLAGTRGQQSVVLCGRNSVQISPPEPCDMDLDHLSAKLALAGNVQSNPYLVRVLLNRHQLTVFRDGRAIVSGTADAGEARAILSRFLGN